jgi:hypothetical protein
MDVRHKTPVGSTTTTKNDLVERKKVMALAWGRSTRDLVQTLRDDLHSWKEHLGAARTQMTLLCHTTQVRKSSPWPK